MAMDAGTPVPLVLLPGMNCSPHLWDRVLDKLQAAHQDGPTGEVRVERLEQSSVDHQVDTLLDRLPTRFALAGFSLGAIVAMAVHRRASSRVAGLLLAATNPRAPTDTQRSDWEAQLAQLAAGTTARDLQEKILPQLIGVSPEPLLRERILTMADHVGPTDLQAQLQLQLSRVDERPGLSRVTVPCLVLAAADDQICPLERSVEIHGLVDSAELVVIPDAPHLVPLSHPQAVAEAMLGWIQRIDG